MPLVHSHILCILSTLNYTMVLDWWIQCTQWIQFFFVFVFVFSPELSEVLRHDLMCELGKTISQVILSDFENVVSEAAILAMLNILESFFKNLLLRYDGPVSKGFLWSCPTNSSGTTTYIFQSLTEAEISHTLTHITYLLFQILLTSLDNRDHHS